MSLITTEIEQAISMLKAGKPVAIPTETVYGMAAMINMPEAIKAVFSLKNRPTDHPLIVHVAQDYDLRELVEEIPDYAKILIKAFWPGPLTLVFRSQVEKINPLITGGQNTVAIRCPAHPLAQQLLQRLKTPLVAPSANPFGKVSPTTAQHVQQSFVEEDLLILDGGRCKVGIESTIVNASQNTHYQILRHGMIDEKAIATVIAMEQQSSEQNIRVPGKLDSHYQPHKKLYYFTDYEQLNVFCEENKGQTYVIASHQPRSVKDGLFHRLGKTPEQVAFDLYYQFRKADESEAQTIAIELPADTSIWYGIRERIFKASFN